MISVGEVMYPLVIEVVLVIAIICNKKTNVINTGSKLTVAVVAFLMMFNLIFVADSVYFIGFKLGICDLPVKSGKMTNVRIVERIGGDSLFDIADTEFKIENSYDYLLREDEDFKVTYTPVLNRVVKIEKDSK
jgi:hypothetical protein